MRIRDKLEEALKTAYIGKSFNKNELRISDGYAVKKSFVVRTVQFLGDIIILANDDVTYISEWMRLDDALSLADDGFLEKTNKGDDGDIFTKYTLL